MALSTSVLQHMYTAVAKMIPESEQNENVAYELSK